MSKSQNNSHPLEILKVIDKLEVESVRLEKRRFIAPYKITQNKGNVKDNPHSGFGGARNFPIPQGTLIVSEW